MAHLKIAIIGTGFSGTALATIIHLLAKKPLELFLFEKTGHFGPGIAYSTTLPSHILNVRAENMSAIETEPRHFLNWLKNKVCAQSILETKEELDKLFVPRFLYGDYLKELLKELSTTNNLILNLIPEEVSQITRHNKHLLLTTRSKEVKVDKAVLAIGNSLPGEPTFSISPRASYLANPWDSNSLRKIKNNDPVVLLGSGLSMIDSVLSLYHQKHKGTIFSISRHGLLPLPHDDQVSTPYFFEDDLPTRLPQLLNYLRTQARLWMAKGEDWRSIITAFREHIPQIWNKLSSSDKERFLRHGLSYWNIHRHRVPLAVRKLLLHLQNTGQLVILSGRILEFKNETLRLKSRGSHELSSLNAKWLINCMGPSLNIKNNLDPLIQALLKTGLAVCDSQELGFKLSSLGALCEANGNVSSSLYALGPPCKGTLWESVAVPEIRKQALALAKHLLGQ